MDLQRFFVIGILSGVNANITFFDTKKTEILQIQEGSIVGRRKECMHLKFCVRI